MANMKTLTVNGVTYTVDDPDSVSFGAAQGLTETQKQQARENIGAVSRQEMAEAFVEERDHEVYLVCNGNTGGKFICDTEYLLMREWLDNDERIRAYLDYNLEGKTHRASTATVHYNGEDLDIAFDFAGLGRAWLDHDGVCRWEDDDSATKTQLDAAVKGVIDRLCPPLEATGNLVTCRPVEGYPLMVTAAPEAAKITRCGKNLAKLRTQVTYNTYGIDSVLDGDTVIINGVSTLAANNIYLLQDVTFPNGVMKITPSPLLRPGKYVVKTELVSGTVSGVNVVSGISPIGGTTQYSYFSIGQAYALEFTQDTRLSVIVQFSSGGTAENARVRVQIEAGSAATDFEPYAGETFAPGETVPALPGVNTVHADAGAVTVTGRADIAALL